MYICVCVCVCVCIKSELKKNSGHQHLIDKESGYNQ